jgi:hypothetical protein
MSNKTSSTFRNTLLATLMMILASGTAALALADEPKVPETAQDHMALAKGYQDKAAAYRKEVEEHQLMAAAYKKSKGDAQAARGQRNPFVVKMEKHCAALAKAAEKLAVDNEKAADYHTLRAKELQGQ